MALKISCINYTSYKKNCSENKISPLAFRETEINIKGWIKNTESPAESKINLKTKPSIFKHRFNSRFLKLRSSIK